MRVAVPREDAVENEGVKPVADASYASQNRFPGQAFVWQGATREHAGGM